MLDIDKAIVQDFVAANFLPTAYENQDYTPTVGIPWAQLQVFVNESIGYSLANSDEATGLMRATLHYPANTGDTALRTMQTAIKTHYPIGRVLGYEGRGVTITGIGLGPGAASGGWYSAYIDVRFISFSRR